MKEYFDIPIKDREKIIKKIQKVLLKEESIVFAFVYGSFLGAVSFRDIDIAVYTGNTKQDEIFDKEMEFSKKIADSCNLSFDIFEVKILNFAPNSFLNNIFKNGRLLFTKDDKLLTDMIEDTSIEAVANEHVAKQSLKELIPA